MAAAMAICVVAVSAAAQTRAGALAESGDLNLEDCKVMAALGRELLHWDKQAPDVSMFAIFYRPQGGGYVEQCPWRTLGVTPLPPGLPDLNSMRFFTSPQYGGDGKSASVDFVTRLLSSDAGGHPARPFLRVETCALVKQGEDWRFKGCKLKAIS